MTSDSDSKITTPMIWFFESFFPLLIWISPGQWVKALFTWKLRKASANHPHDGTLKHKLRSRELTLVELWVVARFIILFVLVLSLSPSFIRSYSKQSFGLASWLILETLLATVILVAINPTLGDDPEVKIHSPIRTISLVFLNYIHVTLMFAVLFICTTSAFKSTFDAFYFSAITITTLGYNDICHSNPCTKWLVVLELYAGLTLIILAISVLVSKLSAIVRTGN